MIWLLDKDSSHQVIGHNVHFNEKENNFEFWITKPSGKTLCVYKGAKDIAYLIKDALDVAIETGEKVFKIDIQKIESLMA